jgi:uncharacterized membrane protein
MAGKFSRSLALAQASWSVVRADKELLLLPFMSVLALLLLIGSFVVPAAALGAFSPAAAGGDPGPALFLGTFVFYVLGYFVAMFFNTALVGAAMIRMDGGNPTLGDGLAIARSRAGRILGYAVIAATVGLLLRAVEERVGWVGQLVVRLIGVAWTVATFLVVPVIVTRDVGPIEAVKESASLLRETWGENLIGTTGLAIVFGVAYFAVLLAGGAGVFVGVRGGLPVLAIAAVVLGVVALVVLSALQATMQGVYSAALYRYATNPAQPIQGFNPDLMQLAFQPKG